MRTIVISDIHNRISWIEDFLAKTEHDYVIFLGDYFDSWDEAEKDWRQAEETAHWLKQSVQYDNRIHLIGNHDIWYLFPDNMQFALQCGGNTKNKQLVVSPILADVVDKFNFIHIHDGFCFSHAGLNISDAHPIYGFSDEYIKGLNDKAKSDAKLCIPNQLFRIGTARKGNAKNGGIIWQDFNNEFNPIEGLNQIVGHTPHKEPTGYIEGNNINIALDTMNNHIAIITDGKVEVFSVKKID